MRGARARQPPEDLRAAGPSAFSSPLPGLGGLRIRAAGVRARAGHGFGGGRDYRRPARLLRGARTRQPAEDVRAAGPSAFSSPLRGFGGLSIRAAGVRARAGRGFGGGRDYRRPARLLRGARARQPLRTSGRRAGRARFPCFLFPYRAQQGGRCRRFRKRGNTPLHRFRRRPGVDRSVDTLCFDALRGHAFPAVIPTLFLICFI